MIVLRGGINVAGGTFVPATIALFAGGSIQSRSAWLGEAEQFVVYRVEDRKLWSLSMFLFDLMKPRSAAASRSILDWSARPNEPVDGDAGLERFKSSTSVTPLEISAARVTTSDLSQ